MWGWRRTCTILALLAVFASDFHLSAHAAKIQGPERAKEPTNPLALRLSSVFPVTNVGFDMHDGKLRGYVLQPCPQCSPREILELFALAVTHYV